MRFNQAMPNIVRIGPFTRCNNGTAGKPPRREISASISPWRISPLMSTYSTVNLPLILDFFEYRKRHTFLLQQAPHLVKFNFLGRFEFTLWEKVALTGLTVILYFV